MSQWVRLWEDMPDDPKWRVIAKRSGRPLHEIIAVFTRMLVNAGRSSVRGTLEGWNDEDEAIALDMEEVQVECIRNAMQGKVLDGMTLAGWERVKGPSISNRPPAYEWGILRNAVFARDNYTCKYCGVRGSKLECDHVLPVSRGGAHTLHNLVTACFECNRAKGSKTISEWRR